MKEIRIFPQGYSMYPFLIPGKDEAILRKLKAEDPVRKGDVIVFRRKGERPQDTPPIINNDTPGILVIHRVVGIKKDGYYFLGDNQKKNRVEGPIRREQMKYVMTHRIREGKRVAVKSPVLFVFWTVYRWIIPIKDPLRDILYRIKESITLHSKKYL